MRIVANAPDVIHLEARSILVRGVVVGRRVTPTQTSVTTFVTYERPAAGLVWAVVGPVHRRLAAFLMEHACTRSALSATAVRTPEAAYRATPWVIRDITPDFRLLDVWTLPMQGGRDDFAGAVDIVADFDPADLDSRIARTLFAIRSVLGRATGWDDATTPRAIPGHRETSLRTRLPRHPEDGAAGGELGWVMRQTGGGFSPLYRTDTEWAAEISNGTVHGVLHLAWVERGGGRYQAEMGVYVKPRGTLGRAYLLAIQPFRHLLVYPALLRQVDREWKARA
jgi:hypothetical protein